MDSRSPWHRKAVSYAVAAIVGVGMLASIAWMLRDLLKPGPPRPSFNYAAAPTTMPKSRVRTELDLAEVPWSRQAAHPTPLLMPLFQPTWSRIARSPQPAVCFHAALPWTRSSAILPAPVSLPVASAPNLPRRREWLKPEPVKLAEADMPWLRTRIQDPAKNAALQLGNIPWLANRPIAGAHVSAAEVPQIRPKREWYHPEPAKVNPAAIPWARDAKSPVPAHLEPAHLSVSRLEQLVKTK